MIEKELLQIEFLKGIYRSHNPLDVPEGFVYDLQNLRLDRGMLVRTPGSSTFCSGAFGGVPLRLIWFVKGSSSFLLLVTTESVFLYTGGAWMSLEGTASAATGAWGTFPWGTVPWGGSAAGVTGAMWDSEEGEFVSYCSFAEVLFICSLLGGVVMWPGHGELLQEVENLDEVEVTGAKFVIPFASRILLGSTIEGGGVQHSRIRWCGPGDYTDWTSNSAGFQDLLDTPDRLINGQLFMDRAVLYKSNSIWELRYVGYPKIVEAAPFIYDVGLLAPASLCFTKEKGQITSHIFLGSDNIYVFSGQLEPIGEAIWHMIYGPNAIVNKSYRNRAQAVYVIWSSEYHLSMPIDPDTGLKALFIYNFLEKSWTTKLYTENVTALGVWKEDTALRWMDLTGAWTAQTWKWIDETVEDVNPLVLFANDTQVLKLDFSTTADSASYLSAFFESKDYLVGYNTRWLEFGAEINGSWSLSYSKDSGVTWTSLGTKTTADWGWKKWGMNVTSEKLRFKLIPGSGNYKARKLRAYYRPRVV